MPIFVGKYGMYPVALSKGFYENGRIAIQAADSSDGSPAFTATVNLPEVKIGEDEAFIKDYSENSGVLAFLTNIGVVKEVIGSVKSGWVTIPLCKIDVKRLDDLIEEAAAEAAWAAEAEGAAAVDLDPLEATHYPGRYAKGEVTPAMIRHAEKWMGL